MFLDDFKRTMMSKGIQSGIYSQHLASAGMNQKNDYQGMPEYTSGHINPMLGTGIRNTRTEQLSKIRDEDRFKFRTSIGDSYFEDIVKGTYIKGKTVYEYFLSFA